MLVTQSSKKGQVDHMRFRYRDENRQKAVPRDKIRRWYGNRFGPNARVLRQHCRRVQDLEPQVEDVKIKVSWEMGTWPEVSNTPQAQMWKNSKDNLLFPSPVCIREFSKESQQKIYEFYRFCCTIVAKAITDDRKIELFISLLFCKLCLGVPIEYFWYEKMDEILNQLFKGDFKQGQNN